MASEKNCCHFFTTEPQAESVPVSDEIGNVDLAGQLNLEANSDDIRELLDSHSQELIIDALIAMGEQEHDIEEPYSLGLVNGWNSLHCGRSVRKRFHILDSISTAVENNS